MRDALQLALLEARELSTADLPRFLGELREIEVTAMSRLTAAPAPATQHDELLSVEEAARRLGMSRDRLYHTAKQFPFTRRLGRSLRFSSLGIDEYIRRQTDLTARRQRAKLVPVAQPATGRHAHQ